MYQNEEIDMFYLIGPKGKQGPQGPKGDPGIQGSGTGANDIQITDSVYPKESLQNNNGNAILALINFSYSIRAPTTITTFPGTERIYFYFYLNGELEKSTSKVHIFLNDSDNITDFMFITFIIPPNKTLTIKRDSFLLRFTYKIIENVQITEIPVESF